MKFKIFLILVLSIFLSACSDEPDPIFFGEDNCSYCRMLISDSRYGAELLTEKGKAYKYDSAECLAAYVLENKKGSDDIKSLWVIDFSKPSTLTRVQTAVYLHSEKLGSPMGMNLSAFSNLASAETILEKYDGKIIYWDDVKKLVSSTWLANE